MEPRNELVCNTYGSQPNSVDRARSQSDDSYLSEKSETIARSRSHSPSRGKTPPKKRCKMLETKNKDMRIVKLDDLHNKKRKSDTKEKSKAKDEIKKKPRSSSKSVEVKKPERKSRSHKREKVKSRRRRRSPSSSDTSTRSRKREKVKSRRRRSPSSSDTSTSTPSFSRSSSSDGSFYKMKKKKNKKRHRLSSSFTLNSNALPEFNPDDDSQNIEMWIQKVNECAKMYEWNDLQICHYALEKLTGLAKRWYQGLPTVLYSWKQWTTKLKSAFPSSENYGDLLQRMLQLRCKMGQRLDEYYYEKMILLNKCQIRGRKAVGCIIHGIDDKFIRLSTNSCNFKEPEQLFAYLKTISQNDIQRNRFRPEFTNDDNNQNKELNLNSSDNEQMNEHMNE